MARTETPLEDILPTGSEIADLIARAKQGDTSALRHLRKALDADASI